MNLQFVENIDDPRLEPYRHLRTTNLTRFSGRFIAESRPLVQRLLASDLQVDSILVDAKRLEEGLVWLPENVPIYVVEHDAVAELIGFQFHRGFLACGLRPTMQLWNPQPMQRDWTGVMFVGVQDPENMGSILRTCAALGIQDIILGPECVDPFARRVLRVSSSKLNGSRHPCCMLGTEKLGDRFVETSKCNLGRPRKRRQRTSR